MNIPKKSPELVAEEARSRVYALRSSLITWSVAVPPGTSITIESNRNMYRFGWKPDRADSRDIPFTVPFTLQTLPPHVDLTSQCPPVYDQLDLGSCTANAIAAAFEFSLRKQNLADFMPSRLFIYYYERVLEGDVSEDNGASLRDGMKVVNKRGVCSESEWPYDVTKFAEAPPPQCSVDALKDKVIQYRRIPQSLAQMKACLASGSPFVFGVNVYQSFMDAHNGDIPVPGRREALLGGHALLCCGYDDATERFLFRNSWSSSWGNQGYGTIPYAYLASRDASDFWEIEAISSGVKSMLALFEAIGSDIKDAVTALKEHVE